MFERPGQSSCTLSYVERRFLAKNGAKEGTAYIYDFEDSKATVSLTDYTNRIMSVFFSPDGQYVATAARDGYYKLWNTTTGELVHSLGTYEGENWVASFSPNGKQVLVSISGYANITIWEMSDLDKAPAVLGPLQLRTPLY